MHGLGTINKLNEAAAKRDAEKLKLGQTWKTRHGDNMKVVERRERLNRMTLFGVARETDSTSEVAWYTTTDGMFFAYTGHSVYHPLDLVELVSE